MAGPLSGSGGVPAPQQPQVFPSLPRPPQSGRLGQNATQVTATTLHLNANQAPPRNAQQHTVQGSNVRQVVTRGPLVMGARGGGNAQPVQAQQQPQPQPLHAHQQQQQQQQPSQAQPQAQAGRLISQDIQPRMFSKEQLIAEMGRAPQDDITLLDLRFVKLTHKMSERYRAVNEQLDAYQGLLAGAKASPDPSARLAQMAKINAQLDEVEKSVKAHLSKHQDSGAMQQLLSRIGTERQLLMDVVSDPRLNDVTLNSGHGFTYEQAMELKRFGIQYNDKIRFDPQHVDSRIASSNEKFASGALNTVAKITYQDGSVKILKPEPDRLSKSKVDDKMGIDPKQPRYGNRNLATTLMDRAIGTNLMPNIEYTIHNNRLCMVMDFAQGVVGHGKTAVQQVPPNDARVQLIEDNLRMAALGKVVPTLEEDLAAYKLKRDVAGDGTVTYTQAKHLPYNMDYHNAELAKAMSNLEWLDYLTGQGDRHAGNYIIDMRKDGSFHGLIGIDSDSSFGANWKDPEVVHAAKLKGKSEGGGYNGVGLPLLIDGTLAATLRAPGAWNRMEAQLSGLLSRDEIAAAKARFDNAVHHINTNLDPRFIVDDWAKPAIHDRVQGTRDYTLATPAQYMMAHYEKSYLGRDVDIMNHKLGQGLQPQDLPV